MRDVNGKAGSIDAPVGAISLKVRRVVACLDAVCGEVRRGWESGTRLPRWDEAVEDAEL